jgi:hypothetical protein
MTLERVIPMEGNNKHVPKYVPASMTVNIFVDPGNPDRICKRTAFAGSVRDDDDAWKFDYDGKPGFQDNYSRDPDSADYSPLNYNRCLKYLHDNGKALDLTFAPVHSRMLRDRWPLLSAKRRQDIIRKILKA